MRKLRLPLIGLALACLCGCAYVHGTTERKNFPDTNGMPVFVESTHLSAYSLLDATQTFNRLSIRSGNSSHGTNVYGPGTYIGGLNETSNSGSITNLIKLLEAAAALSGGM